MIKENSDSWRAGVILKRALNMIIVSQLLSFTQIKIHAIGVVIK